MPATLQASATLEPRATLVSYTDGVTDAVGEEGGRYGLARLQQTLDRCRDCSAAHVIETLMKALEDFQVGAHADDTAVLALRRLSHRRSGRRKASAPPTPAITTLA